MRFISRSIWRKLVVLVIAVASFVLVYETRSLDSTSAALQSIIHRGEASPGAELRFNATAYCKGTTTASGVGVRTGIAAADPQLLPVGSVLNVAVGDDRYNGVYTVMDTGPKVQGRLLDLYIWSCHEALKFGRREVQVTILRLGWNPTASAPRLVDRLFKGREARRVPPAAAPPPAGMPPDDESADSPTPPVEPATATAGQLPATPVDKPQTVPSAGREAPLP
jgi:3D (Asp-Asp-Asp) domain-containing protein